MKQFETHPSWGATEIRIENKRHSHAVHFGSLIPFDLSVRIHPGVSFYRSPDDFAVYLVYVNNRDSNIPELGWTPRGSNLFYRSLFSITYTELASRRNPLFEVTGYADLENPLKGIGLKE